MAGKGRVGWGLGRTHKRYLGPMIAPLGSLAGLNGLDLLSAGVPLAGEVPMEPLMLPGRAEGGGATTPPSRWDINLPTSRELEEENRGKYRSWDRENKM